MGGLGIPDPTKSQAMAFNTSKACTKCLVAAMTREEVFSIEKH